MFEQNAKAGHTQHKSACPLRFGRFLFLFQFEFVQFNNYSSLSIPTTQSNIMTIVATPPPICWSCSMLRSCDLYELCILYSADKRLTLCSGEYVSAPIRCRYYRDGLQSFKLIGYYVWAWVRIFMDNICMASKYHHGQKKHTNTSIYRCCRLAFY